MPNFKNHYVESEGNLKNEQNYYRYLSIRMERMNFIHTQKMGQTIQPTGHSEISSTYASWVIKSLARQKDGGGILVKVSHNWHRVLVEQFFQKLQFVFFNTTGPSTIHRISAAIIDLCFPVPGKPSLYSGLSSQRQEDKTVHSEHTSHEIFILEETDKIVNLKKSLKQSFKTNTNTQTKTKSLYCI